jgi:hypothetical protein
MKRMENVVNKWMYRISKFGPAALLVVGLLVAGEARAQQAKRGCYEKPGNCTVAECLVLQSNVKAPDSCSTPESALKGCAKLRTCSEMKEARSRWLKCSLSRSFINNACFDGGSPEHVAQQAIALEKSRECTAKIENDECEEDPEDPKNPC